MPLHVRYFLLIAGFIFSLNVSAQKLRSLNVHNPEWTDTFPSFRMVGNLYYVGTYDLCCYLITTPKGHILINTGLAESASVIKENVERLGFKFSDIKILLTNQVHFDHVGAMAAIKKMTHAKMMTDFADVQVLADGARSDYLYGGEDPLFVPVKTDRILHDKDTISLGGMKIQILHHPGHTKGACSFLMDVKDNEKTYRVLIANIPTVLEEVKFPAMETYADVQKDFDYTMKAMKGIHFDLWMAAHASQFGLHDKWKPGDGYRPEAFQDQPGYEAAIDRNAENLRKRESGN